MTMMLVSPQRKNKTNAITERLAASNPAMTQANIFEPSNRLRLAQLITAGHRYWAVVNDVACFIF